jgi:hypothetical protein
MSIRSIISILKNSSFPPVKTPLGRWNIHNYKETSLKIKYANEDNCGVFCNNSKTIMEVSKNKEIDDYDEYIYIMGYESVHN